MFTKKQIKKRHFEKKLREAPYIKCACGCGTVIKAVDNYARPHRYLSGHSTPTKYADPTQYKREWNHRNRKARFKYKTNRAHQHKAALVVAAGGKCVVCGFKYDGTNAAVFDFHHRKPKMKEFSLNMASFYRHNKANIVKEVRKCDLLCSNCHRLTYSTRY